MKRILLILTAAAMALCALAFSGCSLLDGVENTAEATPDPFHAGIVNTRASQSDYPSSVSGPTEAPYNPNMRNWQSIMPFPSRDEIDHCNRTAADRSPYIAGCLYTDGASFTQYSARFKADYLPPATYCCLGQFSLDYSALLSRYTSVYQDYDGVSGYAGFQLQRDGRRNSIMSFWNVYCTAADGSTTTITAQLVYPENGQNSFGGEGTGVNRLVDYNWQAGRWYEMRLLSLIHI